MDLMIPLVTFGTLIFAGVILFSSDKKKETGGIQGPPEERSVLEESWRKKKGIL